VNGCAVPVEKLGLARLRVPVLGGKRRDLGDDVSLHTLEKEDPPCARALCGIDISRLTGESRVKEVLTNPIYARAA